MERSFSPSFRLARRWWHELPLWLFYLPVALAFVLLMCRHRSLRAPLTANYGLTNGGLYPSSKSEFFDKIGDEHPFLLNSTTIESTLIPAQARARYTDFTKVLGPRGMVVLKPDDGIRGAAVCFISSVEEFDQIWHSKHKAHERWLLQEYIDGPEVGLFYIRQAPHKPGIIKSMTLKHGFFVSGNGTHTLGELIDGADADQKTKKRITRSNGDRLREIPASGEVIDLAPVRNHHMGATFEDISSQITPALSTRVANCLDKIDGFQFGRLDVRARSFEELFEGKGIKILEVNALYSEPVHAYDPRYNFRQALSIFVSYWDKAFRIGKANMEAGKPQTSFRNIFFPKK